MSLVGAMRCLWELGTPHDQHLTVRSQPLDQMQTQVKRQQGSNAPRLHVRDRLRPLHQLVEDVLAVVGVGAPAHHKELQLDLAWRGWMWSTYGRMAGARQLAWFGPLPPFQARTAGSLPGCVAFATTAAGAAFDASPAAPGSCCCGPAFLGEFAFPFRATSEGLGQETRKNRTVTARTDPHSAPGDEQGSTLVCWAGEKAFRLI